jgi:hypothetical protein
MVISRLCKGNILAFTNNGYGKVRVFYKEGLDFKPLLEIVD